MRKLFDVVQKKLEANYGKRGARIIVCLILIALGMSHIEIKRKLGASFDALRKYKMALKNGNIEDLFVTHNADSRMKSELMEYDEQIMSEFDKNPPRTVREAQERIKAMTGIERGFTRISAYLKKRGLKIGL